MRSLILASLAAIGAAHAAEPTSPAPDLATVHLGVEHSRPLAMPAGAKATADKPRGAAVEEDGHLIPVHLHVDASGEARIECREDHAARRVERRAVESEL